MTLYDELKRQGVMDAASFMKHIITDPYYRVATFLIWEKWQKCWMKETASSSCSTGMAEYARRTLEHCKQHPNAHVIQKARCEQYMMLVAAAVMFKIIGDGRDVSKTSKKVSAYLQCFLKVMPLHEPVLLPSRWDADVLLAEVWDWRFFRALEAAETIVVQCSREEVKTNAVPVPPTKELSKRGVQHYDEKTNATRQTQQPPCQPPVRQKFIVPSPTTFKRVRLPQEKSRILRGTIMEKAEYRPISRCATNADVVQRVHHAQ